LVGVFEADGDAEEPEADFEGMRASADSLFLVTGAACADAAQSPAKTTPTPPANAPLRNPFSAEEAERRLDGKKLRKD
jgi:hypothetical protein